LFLTVHLYNSFLLKGTLGISQVPHIELLCMLRVSDPAG
jgi:hypothetical protein